MAYSQLISISPRGQLVIPSQVRKELGLTSRSKLKLSVVDHQKVMLEPMHGFTDALEGSAKSLKGKDVLGAIQKLREERD